MPRPTIPDTTHPGTRRRSLEAVLAEILDHPPDLPAWTAAQWSAALRRPSAVERLKPLLTDPRIRELAVWVAAGAASDRHLYALGGVLAVIGDTLALTDPDAVDRVEKAATRVEVAVRGARRERIRAGRQAHTTPTPDLDHQPAPPSVPSPAPSRFPGLAGRLLGQAGFDLRTDTELGRRLAAALDVAVTHWTAGARPGDGLPSFRSETVLHSTRRLTARLGADRDLLYLVYGPQPGRGRPIDVARRRGLAYWVALALRASHVGQPVPREFLRP